MSQDVVVKSGLRGIFLYEHRALSQLQGRRGPIGCKGLDLTSLEAHVKEDLNGRSDVVNKALQTLLTKCLALLSQLPIVQLSDLYCVSVCRLDVHRPMDGP